MVRESARKLPKRKDGLGAIYERQGFLEKVHLEAVERSSAKKVRQEFFVKIDEAKAREKESI